MSAMTAEGFGVIALSFCLAFVFLFSVPSSSLPEWERSTLYDDYARQDRVPLPWTPVQVRGKTVAVWGREMRWGENLLPDSITTQGRELLAAPIQIVIHAQGRPHPIKLRRFQITRQRRSRVDLLAEGEWKGLQVQAVMWAEFDGFLWVTLTFTDRQPNRKVDGVFVHVPLRAERMTLYQTFARPLAGWLSDQPIRFAWRADPKEPIVNFYHWFGDEEGGIGFTYTSLQHWAPASEDNFATFIPGRKSHLYRINLIEQAVPLHGRTFQFGIQATPIKPLPPDYFAWKGTTAFFEPWRAAARLDGDVDMALVWPEPAGQFMTGLNNPYQVRRDLLMAVRDECRRRGIAFVGVAHCPQKIAPIIGEEFQRYADEWKLQPESVLEWTGIPHYQNCGRSRTLRKWLFYGWAVKNFLELGLDGLYCDGWMTGQMGCANDRHGCGWTDEKGQRHLTVPVLEGREFNKVMALFLEDHVKAPLPSSAPTRPNFPRYHFWIHSWEFVPSVMGFATAWLTGEFAAYPLHGPSMLKPEGTYGKCLGLGLFRARCLSTNWGIPNLFDPVMGEGGQNHPTNRQTLMALAWFLPHGVPIGLMEYLHQETFVAVAQMMKRFGVRHAVFTPGWRPNPFWQLVTPHHRAVMVATWHHPHRRQILTVISNLQENETANITLRWLGGCVPKVTETFNGTLHFNGRVLRCTLAPESFVLFTLSADEG
jgi:hypothetical protein